MANLAYFTVCVKGSKEACELVYETTNASEIFSYKINKKNNEYICIFDGETKWALEAYTDENLYPDNFDISNPDDEILSKMSMQNKSKLLNVDIEYWCADYDDDWCIHNIYNNGNIVTKLETIKDDIEDLKYDSNNDSYNFNKLLVLNGYKPPVIKKEEKVDLIIENGVLTRYSGKNTEQVLPNTIKSIGRYAFSESNISKINIPNSVETIEEGAFSSCSSLENVVLPNNIKIIPDLCFNWCEKITAINIPDGVREIGNGAFSYCESITEINIPDSVETIGIGAFEKCYRLEKVKLPKNLKKIPEDCFLDCASLKELILPECNFEVENNAFSKIGLLGDKCYVINDTLCSVTLDKNTDINSFVEFAKDIGLKHISSEIKTEIELSDDVVNIPKMFFANSEMKSVVMTDSVKFIGEYSFYLCGDLETIKLSKNLVKIGRYAFASTGLKEIEIPEGVTILQENTFDCNINLKKLIIPGSVWKIDDNLFGDDNYVEDDNEAIEDDEDFAEFKKSLVIYGLSGSEAERFANKHEYKFVSIGTYDKDKYDKFIGVYYDEGYEKLYNDALTEKEIAEYQKRGELQSPICKCDNCRKYRKLSKVRYDSKKDSKYDYKKLYHFCSTECMKEFENSNNLSFGSPYMYDCYDDDEVFCDC